MQSTVRDFVLSEHPCDWEIIRRFGREALKGITEDSGFRKIEGRWFAADQNPGPAEYVHIFHPTDEILSKRFGTVNPGFGVKLIDRWYTEEDAIALMKSELSSQARIGAIKEVYGKDLVEFLRKNGFEFKEGFVVAEKPERNVKLEVGSPAFRMIPLGGGSSIGNSCLYVRIGKHYAILDAGAQETAGEVRKPAFQVLNDLPPPEAIFISHAHTDHIGALEELARITDAPIFMTERTFEIYKIEYERHKGSFPPWLYDRISTFEDGDVNGIRYSFRNAGHIEGSAMVFLKAGGDSLLYTGDFNVEYTEFQKPAQPVSEPVNTLIIEATYANSPERKPREERVKELVQTVKGYVDRGMFVFLPVFSKGRFEEVASIIDRAISEGEITCRGAMGLGLGTEFARIENEEFKNVVMVNHEERKKMGVSTDRLIYELKERMDQPFIVIASSGFMDMGISTQLISEAIRRANVAVVKTGYASRTSMAGSLTAKGDRIRAGDDEVEIKCEVASVSLSAHASRDDIIKFILAQDPREVIFVHREGPIRDLKDQLFQMLSADGRRMPFLTAPGNLCITYTYDHYTAGVWSEAVENSEMYTCECGRTFNSWEGAMMHAKAENHRIIDATSIFMFRAERGSRIPEKYSRRVREKARVNGMLEVRADFTDEEAEEIAESMHAEYAGKKPLYIGARINLPAYFSDAAERISRLTGRDIVAPNYRERDLPYGTSGYYDPGTMTVAIPINRLNSDEDALLVITHETAHYMQHVFNSQALRARQEADLEFVEGFAQYVTEKVLGNLKKFLELYHELGVPEYYMNGRRKFNDIERAFGVQRAIEIGLSGTAESFQDEWKRATVLLEEKYIEEARAASKKMGNLLTGFWFFKRLADENRIRDYVLKNYKKYVLSWEDFDEVIDAVNRALSDYFARNVKVSPGAAKLLTIKYGKNLYSKIIETVKADVSGSATEEN